MSVYFIANITVDQPLIYQKYLDGCDEVFARYHGEYLAVDANPEVVEGEWAYSRVVVIRFPNREEWTRWYESPEYQELLTHRLAGARCDTILVTGK